MTNVNTDDSLPGFKSKMIVGSHRYEYETSMSVNKEDASLLV